MGETKRRVIGYGAAGAMAAGLAWAGFVYEADPDIMTMLGSVDIQLRLASGMPSKDKSGEEPSARTELRCSARRYLDRIDALEPQYPPAREYRAFLACREHDYAAAARLYESLRALPGCAADLRDQSILNESRMLRLSGRATDAELLLRTHLGLLMPEHAVIARRELGLPQTAVDASSSIPR